MKLLIVALLVTLSASSVFASRARLNALGQDGENGSFFIHDNRNIFFNPAHINHTKDLITLEWGQEGGNVDVNNDGTNEITGDSSTAEAGVYLNYHGLVYGVHFGRESDVNNTRALLGGGQAQTAAGDIIDLFLGGDAGIEWGANLSIGLRDGSETNEDDENNSINLRGGVIFGKWEIFSTINFLNRAEVAGVEQFESDLGIEVGGTFSGPANWKYYATVRTQDADLQGESIETTFSQVRLGAGHTRALNDKATLYSNFEILNTNLEVEPNGGAATVDLTTIVLPIRFGIEVDVKNWLTLRGSVGQNFFINESDEDVSGNSFAQSNSTVVNAGASIIFDDFTIDGSFGTGNQSIGFDDEFLSEVSFNYNF